MASAASEHTLAFDDLGEVFSQTLTYFDLSSLPSELAAERLLDRHWIIYLALDDEDRGVVERKFFDHIARRYALEINPDRNRDNVNLLLRLVNPPAGGKILDFGCGPGLSLVAAPEFQIELVGCDVSLAMRREASSHGLATVDVPDLINMKEVFDGMIASYVFHLAVPEADIHAALCSVKIGGRVAANFHKDHGVAEVTRAVTSSGGEFIEVTGPNREHPQHGAIRLWNRVR